MLGVKAMRPTLTNQLHDYINVLNYIAITVETHTIANCDVAYSDINCTVITSYREQIVAMMRAEYMARVAAIMQAQADAAEGCGGGEEE
jgi:hypothetical protein